MTFSPGVHKIITAKDVKETNKIIATINFIFLKYNGIERPVLYDTKMFRYEDVVAFVAVDIYSS